VQHEVGDLVPLHHAGDKSAPILEATAIMGRRQAPEQLVAEMQVDPVNPVAARDQGTAEPIEKARDRALQEQKGSLLADRLSVRRVAADGLHIRHLPR
jgi:hypothetical protein